MQAGVTPWAAVAVLALGLGMFHTGSRRRENHQHRMAVQRIEQAALNVEAIKARYRELVLEGQPALPLVRRQKRLADDREQQPERDQ